MRLKSFSFTVVGLALLVIPSVLPVLPAFAQEISISSSDGSATGTINWTGTKNFNYKITLKSKKGKPVYIEAQGFRDFAPDSSRQRMTGNTTSRNGRKFSNSFSGKFGELKWTGVYLRVCTDISFRPDKCGAPQAYRRQ
ncbi:hypothetical protein [Nostoc sp.]|uniref:hypothetical protein n=1 Tax=Nostoc sp. TaxID=1180 RepID=UPI002FFB27D6